MNGYDEIRQHEFATATRRPAAGFFNGFFGSFVSALLAMFTGATQIFFVVVLLSDRLRLFKAGQ